MCQLKTNDLLGIILVTEVQDIHEEVTEFNAWRWSGIIFKP